MATQNEITPLAGVVDQYMRDSSGLHPGSEFEIIQRRAYQLFEERGQLPDHDLDDWLQAEREVKHHLGIQ